MRAVHTGLAGSFEPGNKCVLLVKKDIHPKRLRLDFFLCGEKALLNLHRPYFARAMQEMPADLPRHPYVASVVAIHRSAWRIIKAIHIMWERAPRLLLRMGLPWSHALSAGVSAFAGLSW